MAGQVGTQHSFGRSSPVRAYWLARCQGFRVVTPGGGTAVVEAVGLEAGSLHAEELAVRHRLSRRIEVIPADAIAEVIPGERVLVVANGTSAAAQAESAPDREGPSLTRRTGDALLRAFDGVVAAAVWLGLNIARAGLAIAAAAQHVFGVARSRGTPAFTSLRARSNGAGSSLRRAGDRAAAWSREAGTRVREVVAGALVSEPDPPTAAAPVVPEGEPLEPAASEPTVAERRELERSFSNRAKTASRRSAPRKPSRAKR
jgi:hypothetical protein